MNPNCGINDKSGTHVQVVPQQEEAETQSHQAPASTASPFEIETDEGNMSNENTTVGVTSTFPEYSTKLIMADKTCADEREKHTGTEQSHPSIITICISEGEKQLLQLLNSVTERYNEKIPNDASSSSLLLTVRIAGGWVRDKILGHPYDQNVVLRIMPIQGGKPKVIATLFGGQGTINVPSWSPDSKKLAFVSYRHILK